MRFECQESCAGRCCKLSWGGDRSYIFLTKSDMIRLGFFLGAKSPTEFASFGRFTSTRFTRGETSQWFLKTNEKGCVFLKDGKCGVYQARPLQCRSFPFWPENMAADRWSKLKEICPGIDEGEVREGKDITRILSEQVAADLEIRRGFDGYVSTAHQGNA